MTGTVHIIGAGLAGLSAAIRLTSAGRDVVVHEATAFAGGRCRSYHDATLGMTIDNGNHLLLSGNRAALDYLRRIGADHLLVGPPKAEFPFADLASGERWTLRFNDGRIPFWVFDATQRVPGTRVRDYLPLARLLFAPAGKTVGEVLACEGVAYRRLVEPLLLAALNIEAPQGVGAARRRHHPRNLGDGRPRLPAVDRARRLGHDPGRAGARLARAARRRPCGWSTSCAPCASAPAASRRSSSAARRSPSVVMMPSCSRCRLTLRPRLSAASRGRREFRAIVNAHFRIAPPPEQPPILGVLNGTVEWIFAFPGRVSVTISAGDRLIDAPREELAKTIWGEVARVTGLPAALPPWQIVRERRATFAATPEQDARRPGPATPWRNLVLAGDWTDTGLPATIEGAIRSGNRAAELVVEQR